MQLGIAAVYLLMARVIHSYFTNNIASVLWPSGGLALAAILLGGKRYAWGVFLGALLTHLFSDPFIWTAITIASGNTLEALIGAWLLTRFTCFDVMLRHPRDYLYLIVLGGGAASLLGASIGPSILLFAGVFTPENYYSQMLQWWMGDVLGVVLIAPLILAWRKWQPNWLGWRCCACTILLIVMIFFIGSIVFLGWLPDVVAPFVNLYWIFLFVTWVAVRFGMRAVLLVILLLTIQSLLGAYSHVGYFKNDLQQTHLLGFWFYTVTLSIVGITLAAYISSEKHSKETLHEQEEFFRLITENVDDYIAVLGLQGQRIYNSPSYYRLFGEPDVLIGSDSFAEIHPEDRERIRQLFLKTVASGVGQRADFRFILPDGSIRLMESTGGVITGKRGEVVRVVVVSRDVTDRALAEEKIRSLAFYDALTQLPNRRLLDDRLAQAMSASKRSGAYGAVIFLDLDNFKSLNDHYGHALGDLLLIEVAQRLLRCVRQIDTVARFGGDEFVVVLNELNTDKASAEAEARQIAEKIAATLAEDYLLPHKDNAGHALIVMHQCSASIGCVLFVDHEPNQSELLKCADMAMYQAKKNGHKQICFPDHCAAFAGGGILASQCNATVCVGESDK
jgi:diguanylate cyclase (GGDEF)-like protein/PAS domain S-box-containing protein